MKNFLFAIFGLCLFNASSQVNLNSSLTACYSLDGNATDAVNALNGVLSSVTPTVDRNNVANSAYAFSGSNSSYIELPNNPLLKSNAVSFSAWVKFNTSASQGVVFTNNGCGSYYEGYAMWYASGHLQVVKAYTCSPPPIQSILNGTVTVNPGTWVHVGFYAGPDSLKLYVNGVLDTKMVSANPITYGATTKVYLGGTNVNPNLPLNGSLDNVRFYNRKINNAEMYQLYLTDPSCAPFPFSSFSFSPAVLCAGSAAAMTDLSSNTPTSWNWQVPGASTSTSGLNNPTFIFPNPGTYSISLTASNGLGSGNTSVQTITVLPSPTLSISSSAVFCSGQGGTLAAGGANTYTWSNGQTGSSIVVFPTQTTSYTVTATNSNGCIASAQKNVTVSALPLISISGNNVCIGGSTSLVASGGAASYTWNTGATGSQLMVSPLIATSYTVLGTDNNGCSNTAQKTIQVYPLPQLSISGNTVICQGLSTSLLVSGTALTYSWSNGFSGNLVSVSPTVSTNYTVTGTDNNGCTNSASQSVFVNTNPLVTANANANPICSGDAAILTGAGASTYLWSGGVSNNTAFYPTTTAVYTLTGTGTNGCKSTVTLQVAVNPKPVLTSPGSTTLNTCPGQPVTLSAGGANIYNWSTGDATPVIVVTPSATSAYTVVGTDANGCKSNLVFMVNVGCAGMNVLSPEVYASVYPNPFGSQITIHAHISGIQIEIYNLNGQKMLGEKLDAGTTTLTLDGYLPGVYFVKLFNSDHKLIKVEKLIRE